MSGRPGPELPPTCEAQEVFSSKAERGGLERGQVGASTLTSHPARTGSHLWWAVGQGGVGGDTALPLRMFTDQERSRRSGAWAPVKDGRWGVQPEGMAAGRVPRMGRGAGGTPELGGSCWWEAPKVLSWSHSEVCPLGMDSGHREGEWVRLQRRDRGRRPEEGLLQGLGRVSQGGEVPDWAWVSRLPRWVRDGDLTQAEQSATSAHPLGRPPSENQKVASVGENAEELEPGALSAGTKDGAAAVGNSPAVPQGLEPRTTVWSSGPASGHSPMSVESRVSKREPYTPVHGSTVHSSHRVEATRVSFEGWWANHTWPIPMAEGPLSHEKARNPDTC